MPVPVPHTADLLSSSAFASAMRHSNTHLNMNTHKEGIVPELKPEVDRMIMDGLGPVAIVDKLRDTYKHDLQMSQVLPSRLQVETRKRTIMK